MLGLCTGVFCMVSSSASGHMCVPNLGNERGCAGGVDRHLVVLGGSRDSEHGVA